MMCCAWGQAGQMAIKLCKPLPEGVNKWLRSSTEPMGGVKLLLCGTMASRRVGVTVGDAF